MPACKECRADVALDENFCGSCGAPVKTEEPLAESALESDLAKNIGVGGSTIVPSAEESDAGTGEVAEPEIGATSRAPRVRLADQNQRHSKAGKSSIIVTRSCGASAVAA